MASEEGSGLSSDPSSTGTAHFGQRAHDRVQAGAGGGAPAAAPAAPENRGADEANNIDPAEPDNTQLIELATASISYAPQRNRSASSTRAAPASLRSASQRGRGVGSVDPHPHHVREGTTPGGSPANRTTAGGAGPVPPQCRLPDPSQASLTRENGGGGPLVDPCGGKPQHSNRRH